jgi:hypothetical protein
MNQSLNLIQDLEFTEATDSATIVVGGLSIACRPIHLDDGDGVVWGGCFPQPRPLPHPRPFPIHEFPRPKPQPWPRPKHPPIFMATAEGTAAM